MRFLDLFLQSSRKSQHQRKKSGLENPPVETVLEQYQMHCAALAALVRVGAEIYTGCRIGNCITIK